MAVARWAGGRPGRLRPGGGMGGALPWCPLQPLPSAQGASCQAMTAFVSSHRRLLSSREGPSVVTCRGGSASFHGRSAKGAECKAGFGLRITIGRHWRYSVQQEGARLAAALYCSSFCSRCLHIAWLQCISATFGRLAERLLCRGKVR